ncbi:hypothetical protein COV18_03670 [Candidatus Woesearchaeota archaeon CG10_big_fil_rev_8_21_14_0_10_37_12]|nr:MAG: hypothetical protein COV18_03670 [Candidatus Woesearchaeota archaeon CG10_big_fil_rev_8_21_14_0_10_37_12]
MKRKVIQLAGKTFVVSLPTTWAREWGIEKGDEIELTERGSEIIIGTQRARDSKRGTADASNVNERTLRWMLSSMHKKGYDEIEIKTKNQEHAKLIDELLKDLFLGFAVVHKSDSHCVVRSVSKELDDQFEIILRRAFLVTLNLADDSLKLIKQKKFDQLPDLISLEKMNNQLTNFCQRLLNKRGHEDPMKTNFMYVIVWNLEKIADDYKYLCEHLSNKKNVSNDVLNCLEHANELIRGYYELFYGFNIEKLSALAENHKNLKTEIHSALEKGKDAVALSHILHSITNTADFSASMFAVHN